VGLRQDLPPSTAGLATDRQHMMNYRRPLILIITGAALISLGCDKRESAQSTPRPAQSAPATMPRMASKAEVKVQANGDLFLYGKPSTLEAVDQRVTELGAAKGVVWYYREA
jgi:hypothetical protein